MPRIAVMTACALGGAACVHAPADEICPAAGAGDVVVTEIDAANDPTWFELYNATGTDLDLEGMVVHLVDKTGATDLRMLIRRPLPVAPGDYVVIGDVPDATRPDTIDYGLGADFSRSMPHAGALTISACGVDLDKVVFDALPTTGSWSYGDTPSAADNDDQARWCTGAAAGTPGSGNPPC